MTEFKKSSEQVEQDLKRLTPLGSKFKNQFLKSTIMAQQINEQFKAQWEKPMFSFFDYLPTKYDANKEDWKVRKLIWDFKDGKRSVKVAKMVAKQLKKQFGSTCDSLTFVCIPASTPEANSLRYEEFAEEVCRLTGAQNAFNFIRREGCRLQ